MRVTSFKSKVHVGWTRCNLAAFKCHNDKRLSSVFVWPVCRLLAISCAGVFVFLTGVFPLIPIFWSVHYFDFILSCYSESSILSLGMVIFYIYAIFHVLLTRVYNSRLYTRAFVSSYFPSCLLPTRPFKSHSIFPC